LELGDLLALGERFGEGLAVEFLQDRLIVEELEVSAKPDFAASMAKAALPSP